MAIFRTANRSDMHAVAAVIRRSFASVAQRFNLTPENCPKHPSNCTYKWVEMDMDRGVKYFLKEDNGSLNGCVALEGTDQLTCYMERLAVVPEMQRQGVGMGLFNYFLKEATVLGFTKIGIGIIAKQYELKRWYQKIGFVETGRKTFVHLPFEVAFMEYSIKDTCQAVDSSC